VTAVQAILSLPESKRQNLTIPNGWRLVTLADVADARLGKMLDAQKNKGNLHPYIRNPNVRWLDIDLSDLQQMLFEDDELEKFAINDGDVLICEGGEAGRAATWQSPDKGVKFQKAIHRVRCGRHLHNQFLVHRLMYDHFQGDS
jgi:type I restriction enzyme S subunit